MKPQDIYSNMYKNSELASPYVDNRQGDIPPSSFKVSMTHGGSSVKKKPKPSRMPNLSFSSSRSKGPKDSKRPSVISTADSINIVGILKRELQKINCNLKNYFVRSHIRGVDIEKIQVFCSNIRELKKTIRKMDVNKILDHERMKNTTSLALMAISKKFKNKLRGELKLEAELFDFEDSDYGVISVTVPVAKKQKAPAPAPLPPPPPMPMPTPSAPEQKPIGPEPGSPEEALATGNEALMPPLEIENMPPEQGAIEEAPEENKEEELPGSIEPEEQEGKETELPELL